MASAPGISRIVRGLVHQPDAAASTSPPRVLRRESALYIMVVELLPNCRGPLIADFCLRIGYTTITIGMLGFLGLGLPPPNPDWGGMVKQATRSSPCGRTWRCCPCFALVWLVLGSICWPTG